MKARGIVLASLVATAINAGAADPFPVAYPPPAHVRAAIVAVSGATDGKGFTVSRDAGRFAIRGEGFSGSIVREGSNSRLYLNGKSAPITVIAGQIHVGPLK